MVWDDHKTIIFLKSYLIKSLTMALLRDLDGCRSLQCLLTVLTQHQGNNKKSTTKLFKPLVLTVLRALTVAYLFWGIHHWKNHLNSRHCPYLECFEEAIVFLFKVVTSVQIWAFNFLVGSLLFVHFSQVYLCIKH